VRSRVSARAIGPHDRRVLGVATQAGDERVVDLEDVDGETPEVGQRRVAGAEVVDRDLDAEGLE